MHPFYRQSGVVTTLALRNNEGLYSIVLPFVGLMGSGSKCAAITIKLKYAVEDIIYVFKIILQSEATIKLLAGKE